MKNGNGPGHRVLNPKYILSQFNIQLAVHHARLRQLPEARETALTGWSTTAKGNQGQADQSPASTHHPPVTRSAQKLAPATQGWEQTQAVAMLRTQTTPSLPEPGPPRFRQTAIAVLLDTYFEQSSNHPIEHIPLRLATNSNAANKKEVWSGILRVRKCMQVKNRPLFSDTV